ncbi:MAG: phenylalanine--tRNA ligase subunit alpha, partial [Methanoregulaceae archaeon]|nr:phenylalanine--tRNA ligase subunit alpha [Methanoregulaceae archaeon]
MDLTVNEKRLLSAIGTKILGDPEEIARALGTREDAVIQWAHLLEDRGLAEIEKDTMKKYTLTDEGVVYARDGLPERQLLISFEGRTGLSDLKAHPLSRIGIGWMRKKGWVVIREGTVEKTGKDAPGPDEEVLSTLQSGGQPKGSGIEELLKRGLVVEHEEARYRVRLTPAGVALASSPLDLRAEVGTLTREQILSGEWKTLPLRKYRIDLLPRRVFPGKIHPYTQLIKEMRDLLLEMGFVEIQGDLVQSSFWNFDALFQPQDHPAREMQDTFYLAEKMPAPVGYERVKEMHERGGTTSSTGWGGRWSLEKAEQCVLRTHTTCLSIRHLAAHPKPPVKAFCISRVYRREAVDPTHLPEFEQLEGIVMDRGVNFRHLLGYLKEFYHRMGFENMRFRPA